MLHWGGIRVAQSTGTGRDAASSFALARVLVVTIGAPSEDTLTEPLRRAGLKTIVPVPSLEAFRQAFAPARVNIALLLVPGTDVDQLKPYFVFARTHAMANVRAAPIVTVSTTITERMVKSLLNFGADDILVWPMDDGSLASRLRRTITHPLDYFRTPTYFGPDRRRALVPQQGREQERRIEAPPNVFRVTVVRDPATGCRIMEQS